MAIGGGAPISVQSMTKTRTSNIDATVTQILQLEQAGCDIIRVAVPDEPAARALVAIKQQINIPLVADIQFDYRLALLAIEAGIDKIRINPGNIGNAYKVRQILQQARERNIPIRIGVNSGSVGQNLLKKYGCPCAEALVESAMRQIEICEALLFENLVVSLKSSDVKTMIKANRMIAPKIDYPLHLGVTEAGTLTSGLIKSALGIGVLLNQGIGDTIRVSLTDDPGKEVEAGINLLRALNLRRQGVNIISCPGCGRSEVDWMNIVREIESHLSGLKKPVTVAIMGCAVNGPGEARQADIGVACGKTKVSLFKQGKIIRTITEPDLIPELLKEIWLS